jgi:hypothetical protein
VTGEGKGSRLLAAHFTDEETGEEHRYPAPVWDDLRHAYQYHQAESPASPPPFPEDALKLDSWTRMNVGLAKKVLSTAVVETILDQVQESKGRLERWRKDVEAAQAGSGPPPQPLPPYLWTDEQAPYGSLLYLTYGANLARMALGEYRFKSSSDRRFDDLSAIIKALQEDRDKLLREDMPHVPRQQRGISQVTLDNMLKPVAATKAVLQALETMKGQGNYLANAYLRSGVPMMNSDPCENVFGCCREGHGQSTSAVSHQRHASTIRRMQNIAARGVSWTKGHGPGGARPEAAAPVMASHSKAYRLSKAPAVTAYPTTEELETLVDEIVEVVAEHVRVATEGDAEGFIPHVETLKKFTRDALIFADTAYREEVHPVRHKVRVGARDHKQEHPRRL